MSRELVRPEEIPASLADGPRGRTDASRVCKPCGANQLAIDRAAALWDDCSREQWESLMPADRDRPSKPELARSGPYFKWSCTVGPRASSTVGHAKEAYAWAVASNRANELSNLVECRDS